MLFVLAEEVQSSVVEIPIPYTRANYLVIMKVPAIMHNGQASPRSDMPTTRAKRTMPKTSTAVHLQPTISSAALYIALIAADYAYQ